MVVTRVITNLWLVGVPRCSVGIYKFWRREPSLKLLTVAIPQISQRFQVLPSQAVKDKGSLLSHHTLQAPQWANLILNTFLQASIALSEERPLKTIILNHSSAETTAWNRTPYAKLMMFTLFQWLFCSETVMSTAMLHWYWKRWSSSLRTPQDNVQFCGTTQAIRRDNSPKKRGWSDPAFQGTAASATLRLCYSGRTWSATPLVFVASTWNQRN